MLSQWFWIPLGAIVILLLYQQLRIYRIQREAKTKEELFQIVTENAADMIALVDVKGRRLYNSPAYKKILGYSAAELGETSAFEQIHPDDRFQGARGRARGARNRRWQADWSTASSTKMEAGAYWSRWPARFATARAKWRSW